MSTQDPRITKTKNAIYCALTGLLTQHDLDDITVTDIASEAHISRKTFYTYYASVDAVVTEAEQKVVTVFGQFMDALNWRQALTHPQIIFEEIHAILFERFEFANIFSNLSPNRADAMLLKLTQSMAQHIKQVFPKTLFKDARQAPLAVDFLVGGLMAVYRQWFQGEDRNSLESLYASVATIAFHGLNGVLTDGSQE